MSTYILVVDDEPDVETLFRQQFRRDIRSGRFVMEFAASAPEALERAKTIADPMLILILSDINMPGMSGLEMLPKVKASRPKLPVIMALLQALKLRQRRAAQGARHLPQRALEAVRARLRSRRAGWRSTRKRQLEPESSMTATDEGTSPVLPGSVPLASSTAEAVALSLAPPVPQARRERDLELGLCLSGGGFRAMLFHGGALARLNELGYLRKLDAISSVSGGSIAAGLLGVVWCQLDFEPNTDVARNFNEAFLRPLLSFAQTTVDFPSIVHGVAAPWTTASRQVAKRYRALLGVNSNLNKLPTRPRFIFCSSNLTTGSLFRFSRDYIADYRLGLHRNPDLDLATAVAASAAFPPVLSPLRLDLSPFRFVMESVDGTIPLPADPALLRRAVLTDGGVYDNHGLQPLLERCHTLLVGDGGAPWTTSTAGYYRWLPQLKRVLDVTDNQVRALRRQDLISRFMAAGDHSLQQLPENSSLRQHFALKGTYWSISADPRHYRAGPGDLVQPRWRRLAAIGTWLHFLGERETEDLVNWGYLVSDLALRSYVDPQVPVATSLPVPLGTIRAGWRPRAAKWIGDHLPMG